MIFVLARYGLLLMTILQSLPSPPGKVSSTELKLLPTSPSCCTITIGVSPIIKSMFMMNDRFIASTVTLTGV